MSFTIYNYVFFLKTNYSLHNMIFPYNCHGIICMAGTSDVIKANKYIPIVNLNKPV